MAVLSEYFSGVAREMKARSSVIRRDFVSHRLSAGENREDLVAEFLKDHFPIRFDINRGMVISHDGVFSNQADDCRETISKYIRSHFAMVAD